jgi:hypothetical protein
VDGYSDVFTGITNSAAGATGGQIIDAEARTYIVGSNVAITAGRIAVGTLFRWRFGMTKTAAGSAGSTIDIAFGIAGTTADTARVSFAKPAGTGAIDFAAVVAQLPEGMIHVEGGPQFNAALLDAGLVDAINLTWSPRMIGSRGSSISAAPHALQNFSLASLTTQEEFVFARYERRNIA